MLLGIGTYSKPIPIAVLVAPIVLLAWLRQTLAVRLHRSASSPWPWRVVCFAFNAAVSGEFNYQGGDRKYFALQFPVRDAGSDVAVVSAAYGHDRHIDAHAKC